MTNTKHAAICTVATRSHLHYVHALIDSIRAIYPDIHILVCVVDADEDITSLSTVHTRFVPACRLDTPNWKRFRFQYTAFELCCALKPAAMRYCLQDETITHVIYLDSDMQLYGELHEVIDERAQYSIALTPHLTEPLPDDGKQPGYETFQLAGAYNGGFLAVTRRPEGVRFLDWWHQLLAHACYVDLAAGHFVDQKPLSSVPGLFDEVKIIRRAGFHLAYWNLHGRRICEGNEGYHLADGDPLTLFHFSGVNLDDPECLSSYQDRIDVAQRPVLRGLLYRYIKALNTRRREYESESYAFAKLSDGTLIQPEWRELVRMNSDAVSDVADPFDTTTNPNLLERYRLAARQARAQRDLPSPDAAERRTRFKKRVRDKVENIFGCVGLRPARSSRPTNAEIPS